jgi:hypothetical protein
MMIIDEKYDGDITFQVLGMSEDVESSWRDITGSSFWTLTNFTNGWTLSISSSKNHKIMDIWIFSLICCSTFNFSFNTCETLYSHLIFPTISSSSLCPSVHILELLPIQLLVKRTMSIYCLENNCWNSISHFINEYITFVIVNILF